jgi:hypothetical protein
MYFPAILENTIQHNRVDSLVNTMDIDTPPNPEISFHTVLDAVNRQSQETEAKVDAKIS